MDLGPLEHAATVVDARETGSGLDVRLGELAAIYRVPPDAADYAVLKARLEEAARARERLRIRVIGDRIVGVAEPDDQSTTTA